MSSLSPSSDVGAASVEADAHVNEWIRKAAAVCRRAAVGDLESRLLEIDVDGDLGDLLHSINDLLDLTDAFVREAGASLEFASQDKYFRRVLEHGLLGSFRHTARTINMATEAMAVKNQALRDVRARQLQLADDFESHVHGVVDAVASASTELKATAQTMNDSADKTTQQVEQVNASANAAGTGINSITEAMERLSTGIHKISSQAIDSTKVAQEAMEESERAAERVRRLSDSSDRIRSVIQVIRGVAQQTNLLALNATIEAARAGEIGKGFAVVAAEVKNLSAKIREATEDIEGQVHGISTATGSVVDSIDSVEQTLGRIDNSSSAIATAVEQQEAVSREVSGNMHDASEGAQSISDGIDQVARSAESTSTAASQLVDASGDLSALAERLRGEVDSFLAEIRQESE